MLDSAQHKEVNARKITFLRNQRKLSQMQLANKIKIPKPRLGSYEEGRAVIPYKVIVDLCTVFGITLDEFEKVEIPQKVKA